MLLKKTRERAFELPGTVAMNDSEDPEVRQQRFVQLFGGKRSRNGVRILDRGSERCAIVTFKLGGWTSEALVHELRRRGINSSLSAREHALYDFTDKEVDACVRLSPHYYNTEREVADVVAAVRELAAR